MLVSLVSRTHRGLDTKDDLVHQIIDAGEQEGSGLWLLRGALIPQIESIGAQHALERSADHDRDGALLHKSFKHVAEHGGLLDGKIKEFDSKIFESLSGMRKEMDILMSIPGVGFYSSCCCNCRNWRH